MLVDLLPDLVRDWQHEVSGEAHVAAETLGKVFWRIVRIVYVPFKLVAENYIAYAHMQLYWLH